MLGLKTKLEKWSVLERFNLAWRKYTEAFTSCMLCMVGGDLTVVSWNHVFTASKTGTGSALALLCITLFTKIPSPPRACNAHLQCRQIRVAVLV